MTGGGKCCSVVKCGNCNRKLKKWKETHCELHPHELHKDCPCLLPFSFFRFPKDEKEKHQWLVALNRKDFIPGKEAVVCSCHFVDGKPTKMNPVPALHLGYERKVVKSRRLIKRFDGPPKKKQCTAEASSHTVPINPEFQGDRDPMLGSDFIDTWQVERGKRMSDVGVQCDLCPCSTQNYHNYAKNVNTGKAMETKDMGTLPGISYKALQDRKVLFYTGLRKTVVDELLLLFTSLNIAVKCKLNVADQLLLVLMRLRLGLLIEDLADRFCVSPSFVSKLFSVWIKAMSSTLQSLVCWLPRDVIWNSMPPKFREMHPSTTCVIDCTEMIFMQRATRHRSRSQTYSNYKSHNTVKFLVAIAPHGYVMYISPCYGGRASDKFIAVESGFMNMLLPGDEVMADRGFTIESELANIGVTLNLPTFTAGKPQLAEQEVTETRRIASSRIHVERLIRRLKCYHILNTVTPINNIATIEHILMTCAALVNLKPPLIDLDCE